MHVVLDPQAREGALSRQLRHPIRGPAVSRRACEPGGDGKSPSGTSQAWRGGRRASGLGVVRQDGVNLDLLAAVLLGPGLPSPVRSLCINRLLSQLATFFLILRI